MVSVCPRKQEGERSGCEEKEDEREANKGEEEKEEEVEEGW